MLVKFFYLPKDIQSKIIRVLSKPISCAPKSNILSIPVFILIQNKSTAQRAKF